jgi:hypothetical protein
MIDLLSAHWAGVAQVLSQSSAVGSEEFRDLSVRGADYSCMGLPFYMCHQFHEGGGGEEGG